MYIIKNLIINTKLAPYMSVIWYKVYLIFCGICSFNIFVLLQLTRPAQELLMSLALNCNSHSSEDVEVISNLIRMRLKTKPLANHYVACIKYVAMRSVLLEYFSVNVNGAVFY